MGHIARLAWASCLFLLAIMLVGCGGGGGTTIPTSPTDSGLTGTPRSGTGTVTFTLNWVKRTRVLPEATESIEVALQRTGAATVKQYSDRPNTDEAITSDISFSQVPEGNQRYTITAYAGKNKTGTVLGTATGSVTVRNNQDTDVTVATIMHSTVSKLAIDASGDTLLVKKGNQLALIATATNAVNAVLPLGAHCLQWVSANPAIAAVNADTGVVTGIKGGSTTVTVTDQESGISDRIKIVVDDFIVTIKVTTVPISYSSSGIVDPGKPTTATLIKFRAEASNGTGPYPTSVQAQWDWDNDRRFDTGYLNDVETDHVFPTAGQRTIRVRAKDLEGRTTEATAVVDIAEDANPVHVVGSYYDFSNAASITTASRIYFQTQATNDTLDSYEHGVKILQGYVRWDWNNDGAYDTEWYEFRVNPDYPDPALTVSTYAPSIYHTFSTTGDKVVNVQIRDRYNRVGTDTMAFTVDNDIWKP